MKINLKQLIYFMMFYNHNNFFRFIENMYIAEIQNKIQKILNASLWSRIFYWQSIVVIITELKMLLENTFSNYENTSAQKETIEKELSELKINYQAQQTNYEDLKNQIKILIKEKEILTPLKIKNVE